jgi:eukaryotic-like serine/threonine-protein kinase
VRKVPDIVEMAWDRAEKELVANDLEATKVEENSDTVAAGNVIRTDPIAGTRVESGEEITVYVSTGQKLATVPRLENLSREEATAALDDAGLTLGTVTTRNDPKLAADTVISASIDEGAEVAVGTSVNVVVASGKVTVVDMSGYSVDAAERALEADDLGLTANVVEDANCAGNPDAPIVKSQSAVGDVAIGSTIDLVVCTGS